MWNFLSLYWMTFRMTFGLLLLNYYISSGIVVLLGRIILFFEELLFSLNYCSFLWRTVFFEILLYTFNYFCCSLNYCCVLWWTSLCFHVIKRVCLRPFMFIALFCMERRTMLSIITVEDFVATVFTYNDVWYWWLQTVF